MIIELDKTSAAAITRELTRMHQRNGTSAMAFTLVVVTDEKRYEQVLTACLEAGGEHPSRILVVVQPEKVGAPRPAKRGKQQQDADGAPTVSELDATIHVGEGIPGDLVTLRMWGELSRHAASVVLPLLLPDSQVVAWWPHRSPENPADDPIGQLATRRITDALGAKDPIAALATRAHYHAAGDTDLTWTRLTPWRALLAAALDQFPSTVHAARVEAAKDNAPAELMAAWLQARLGIEVERTTSDGPGITAVRLTTKAGDIAILRPDDQPTATYLVPGQPHRQVALRRRDLNDLITEELRRADADVIFEEATQTLLSRAHRSGKGGGK